VNRNTEYERILTDEHFEVAFTRTNMFDELFARVHPCKRCTAIHRNWH